jgi:hypothetical protein
LQRESKAILRINDAVSQRQALEHAMKAVGQRRFYGCVADASEQEEEEEEGV